MAVANDPSPVLNQRFNKQVPHSPHDVETPGTDKGEGPQGEYRVGKHKPWEP